MLRSTVIEQAPAASDWIGSFRRFSSWCLCSAVLASSLHAAEPAAPRVSPLDRLKDRSASQRWQESRDQYLKDAPEKAARVTAPASQPETRTVTAPSATATADASAQPEPLDMPLSGFGHGRTAEPNSRPPLPSLVKSVPGPYFDESPTAAGGEKSPLIALPDFLDSGSIVPPLAQAQPANPLAPGLNGDPAQVPLPIPDEPGASGIPGMDDTVFRPISQIQPYYDYSPTGKRPYEYICPQPSSVPDNERARCPELQPLPKGGSTDRHFALVDFQWVPSNLHHKPLYFQDVALERYGQKVPCGLQPFVSVGKFAAQGIGLPYQIAIDPLWRDIYPLGYYRPGDAAPELIYQVPFNLQAAAAAGGVYTGLIFLIP